MSAQPDPPPRVCVVLSTYNGERYLREQLDSLLAQTGVVLSILVRDDGSRDATTRMLREFADRHPVMRVVEGTNLGVVASYLELLRLAGDSDAAYFAFCDQDDVWLPEKLSAAVRRLERASSTPQLYCSAVRYVNASLQPIGTSRTHQRPGFDNALVENIAVGCTTVFNRALLELANSAPPRTALMHDWWLYLTASAFGHVVFDPRPAILYRQHGGNVVGGTTSIAQMMFTRFRRLKLRREGVFRCSDQAREFLRCFGDRMSPAQRALIEDMLAARTSLGRRFRLATSGRIRRAHWLDNQLLRVLVIAGLY
jgi:glycosyltransferase involved in cell wall biosynthesis